mgnify:CR=1 FL=1
MNRKEIAILALIVFFTVIAWILFGIFHARSTSSVTSIQLKEVVPLTPTFDNDIIKQLIKREEQ